MNKMNRMQYCPENWEAEENQEAASQQHEPDWCSVLKEALDVLNELVCVSLCDRAEELVHKYGTPLYDPQVVMLIAPDSMMDVATAEECEALLDELGDYSEVESIFEDSLLIRYDAENVVTLGGVRYLLGYGVIFEIDEYGNECNIDSSTIEKVMDFMYEKRSEITVDGQIFDAFRLE